MGVTNRNEVQYKNPEHMSSTESLHIPLSTSQNSLVSVVSAENVQIPRLTTRRQKRHKAPGDVPLSSPRNAGRRRQRRYTAVAELASLIEEEEPEVFLEEGIPHNSPFISILENPDLEKVWDNITQEEEAALKATGAVPKGRAITASYTNISFNVRMSFKMMRSFFELERTETEIVEFFTAFPEKSFISADKTSYQRLLIHAVAQYYCLKSTSFDAETGKRTIKVDNPNNFRDFREKRLVIIVEDNHKRRL